MGVRNALAVVYSAEVVGTNNAVDRYLSHFGSARWSHIFSPYGAVLLEGGASFTPDAEQVGLERKQSFFGGLTVARKVGRSSVAAYLRREVAPAFGFGVSRLETRGGLRGDIPLGRHWSLWLDGYHTRPSGPSDSDLASASATDGLAGISRSFGRTSLTADVRYRRRGETASQSPVSAFQFSLAVSIGTLSRPIMTERLR